MRKIGTLLLAIVLLNVLMAAGLVAFVVATGRLDGAKAQVIVDLVRKPGTPKDLRTQVAALLVAAPATAPATQAGTRPGGPVPFTALASASDRVEYARQAMEQERLRLEREAQDLQHRQNLLDTQRREVEAALAKIDAEKKKFQAQVQAAEAKAKEENFTRTLALYRDLKSKQVKDLFMGMNEDLVADYFKALEAEQTTKIIGEFKTADERAFVGRVLERIRSGGTSPASGPGVGAATMPGTPARPRDS